MSGRLFAFTLLVALVAPMAFGATATAQDPGRILYRLIIDCQEARAAGSSVSLNSDPIRCPVRAEDGQDMMGSPSIGVSIRNPSLLVMSSLHGGDADGPSIRSRQGLTFTTFTSQDGGRSWRDNPYGGPPGPLQGGFGEHVQIVTDPYGHVFVGSLYSKASGPGQFSYVLAAQKFENLERINNFQASQGPARPGGSYNLQLVDTFYPASTMTQFWYLYNPRTDNMSIVWHETKSIVVSPPPSKSLPKKTDGEHAHSHGHGHSHDVAALLGKDTDADEYYMSQSPGKASSKRPFSTSVIAYAWSNTSMKAKYHYALEENLIGPCMASTNPVWSEGWTYVGCVANPTAGPFRWNPLTKDGQVEIFRFQPETGLPPQYVGSAPIASGSPKLGLRSDGRLAVFSASVTAEGELQLLGTFGTYAKGKIAWSTPKNYAEKIPLLHQVSLQLPFKTLEANIQDLEYREYSGAVHMILKQVVEYQTVGEVGNPLAGLLPKYRKTLIAVDERYGYLAGYNMDIGRATNRTDPWLRSQHDDNYNDLADDIVQLPPMGFSYKNYQFDDLYQREFFAVADYGIVIFAEVIEVTDLRPPGVPPGPPGPPPVPAPALATTPSAVILPLVGSTFAGLLAFALIANRRKNPLAAFTKGE